MTKAYWVVTYQAEPDEDKRMAYGRLAFRVVLAHGGRFLARGNASAAREAGRKLRTVLIEFPSMEQALATYESPGYKEALAALADGAVRDFRIIEGLEGE